MDTEHQQDGEDTALNKLDDIEVSHHLSLSTPTSPLTATQQNTQPLIVRDTPQRGMDLDTCTESNQAPTAPSGKVCRRINVNHYATKKTAAQSMLDVALLMANSSQLKSVLYVGPRFRFYIPLIVLLSLSITLQVTVGLLLIFIVKYNLNDVRKHSKLNKMNNIATVFVFLTVLINILITALGFEGHADRSLVSPVMAIPEPQLSPQPPDFNTSGSV